MMQPKRTKYRKQFKGTNAGLAQSGNYVAFGDYGLKATSRARMTARELEAARRAMTRYVKRGGQIWVRVFPDVPITKKPLEVRMGSGKGNVEYYIAKVKPGKVLFEMEGVTEAIAREAFRLAASKLSVDTQFVTRQVRSVRHERERIASRSRLRICRKSCWSCAASSSTCAWRGRPARPRSRTSSPRCAATSRA